MKTILKVFLGPLIALAGLIIYLVFPEKDYPFISWLVPVIVIIGASFTVFFMLRFEKEKKEIGKKVPIEKAIKMAMRTKPEHQYDAWQKICHSDDFWKYVQKISRKKAIRLVKKSDSRTVREIVLNRDDVTYNDVKYRGILTLFFPYDYL